MYLGCPDLGVVPPPPLPTFQEKKVTNLLDPTSVKRGQNAVLQDYCRVFRRGESSNKCGFPLPSNYWMLPLKIWEE